MTRPSRCCAGPWRPGSTTSTLAHLEENLAAASITLDQAALDELEHAQLARWGEHAG
jgi:aryl-alcohol dehydrogenase-like predicted oxidoreductase